MHGTLKNPQFSALPYHQQDRLLRALLRAGDLEAYGRALFGSYDSLNIRTPADLGGLYDLLGRVQELPEFRDRALRRIDDVRERMKAMARSSDANIRVEAERHLASDHFIPPPVAIVDGKPVVLPKAKLGYPNEVKHVFVMDGAGNIYVETGEYGKIHHSSLGGNSVTTAGEIRIKNGTVVHIDNHSGHYRPPPESLEHALARLRELGVDVKNVLRVGGN